MRSQYAPAAKVSACTSCTAGLSAAILALDVEGPVLIPGFTFPATREAVRATGVPALIADVDPGTGVISTDHVASFLKTVPVGAVMAVRLYGIWSDFSGLRDICQAHHVPLIIDNASGFGVDAGMISRYSCREAIEVFSLHITKPAGIGEGGLLLYHPALHDAIRAALNFGMTPGTSTTRGRGLNGRMDEVRAAIARAMLPTLPARVKRRRSMIADFVGLARDTGLQSFVHPGEEDRQPGQCFPVLLPDAASPDRLIEICLRAGLQVRRYYHPVLDVPRDERALRHASDFSKRVVCLPVYDDDDAGQASEMWSIFADSLSRVFAPFQS